jgi:hypothetical protein
MIKHLLSFFLLLITLIIASGDVKAENEPGDGRSNLNISLDYYSGNSDILDMPKDSIKYSLYVIYDSKGQKVKSSTFSFVKKQLNESLPLGDYRVVLFASDKPLTFHMADNLSDLPGFIYTGIAAVYHKSFDVTVSKESTEKSVMLDRLSSVLELNFMDTGVPAGISEVQFTWTDRKYISFDGKSITNTVKQKSASTASGKPESFKTLIYNTESPINFHINYLDSKGNLIHGKTIENIVCGKNSTTTLSGFLFSETSNDFTPLIASQAKL